MSDPDSCRRVMTRAWRLPSVVLATATAIAVVGMAQASARGTTAPRVVRQYTCLRFDGHPYVVDGVIENLRHITVQQACIVTRAFVAWDKTHDRLLSTCTGKSTDPRPVLKLHSFDGYRLSLGSPYGGLELSHGHSSFETGGYDGWPTGCEPS